MVLRPDVLAAAIDSVADGRPMLALTPRGSPLTQARVRELASGRGRDPAVRPLRGIRRADLRGQGASNQVSIGDYVLSGGELGAMVILDACVRLLPGVMGAASSGEEESFETGLLEYPHYTRPVDMGRAHDPRSAAIGGSCEDRGVATRTRGRRYTAKAAGPDRAPRGRIAGTALWRAATRYEG